MIERDMPTNYTKLSQQDELMNDHVPSDPNAITELCIVQSQGGGDERYAKLKVRFACGRRISLDLSHAQVGQILGGIQVDVTANHQDIR